MTAVETFVFGCCRQLNLGDELLLRRNKSRHCLRSFGLQMLCYVRHMKLPAYFVSNHSPRPLLAAATVFMTAVLLTGCSSPADTKPDSAPGASTSASAVPSELQQVDGRAVSATDTELVLRTAEGDRTFQINEEDLQAIDPAHYNSHAGIPSIGFRVYYRTEGGVEKVVSVEEIAGSTLGFD